MTDEASDGAGTARDVSGDSAVDRTRLTFVVPPTF